jgi:hypothetical protein
MKTDFPVTPAIRVLRENNVEFEPHIFDYVEKGGTKHSSLKRMQRNRLSY